MENILELGGETFKIVANFRMSYNLTKYRNKLSTGFDFSKGDKKVVAEILKASRDENFDYSKLSQEALVLLQSRNTTELFNDKDIFDIVKILTRIEDDAKIEELLDKEVELNGYDQISVKLANSINLVFTSAKDTSTQKAVSKAKLVEVADK